MYEKIMQLRWPYAILSMIVFGAALAICLPMAGAYPFHFTFDMDHTTTLDSFVMQDGQIPSHINHPAFGMYFLLAWAHRIAYWFGAVSALTFRELSNALDPFLPMVELKVALRGMAAWMAAATMWMFWFGCTARTAIPRVAQVLLAIIPLSLYPLIFLSSHIRTELFATFYLAAALAFLFDASRAELTREQIRNRVMAGGGALALAEFTKIQATVGILVVVAIYFYLTTEQGPLRELLTEKLRRRLTWIIGLGWPLLLLAAAFKKAQGATFTDRYKINPLGCVFVILPLLLLACEHPRFKHRVQRFVEQRGLRDVLLCFFFGAILVMLLHFAFYVNPYTAFKHLLLDVKMVFERNNYNLVAWGGWVYLARSTWNSILYQPGIFLANMAVVGILAYKLQGVRRIWLLIAAFLAYMNIYLSVRMNIHDTVWTLGPITMISLLCLRELMRAGGNWQKVGVAAALFLIGAQWHESAKLQPLTRSSYSLYGFDYPREFSAVYVGQEAWPELMDVRYPATSSEQRTNVLMQGIDLVNLRSLAHTVVPNLPQATLRLSSVRKGLPVLRSRREFRIVDFSPELAGAALIDLEDIDRVGRFAYDDEYVQLPQNAALLLRLAPQTENPVVSIIRRQDLQILWFAPPEELERDQFKRPSEWTPVNYFIRTLSGDSLVEYRAYHVNKHTPIPLPGPKGGFLVIRKKTYEEFTKSRL